jgi:uncharacterized protein DUF1203
MLQIRLEVQVVNFRVLPIPTAISEQIRITRKSPQYGHPAHSEPAAGYGPCRSCLRQFRVDDDRRLLFTYNPFEGLDTYPSPGPIFIHEDACTPFHEIFTFPQELRSLPLTLEGYGRGRWLIARERPHEADIEVAIMRLFENASVDYIHVRNTEAGCFIAQILRVDTTENTNDTKAN